MTELSFLNQVNEISEQTIQLCNHCHKCTSGCPVVPEMRFGPDQILLMVQLGEKEETLKSPDIWICASCETCGTRCPNEIDISRVMDALRHLAHQEKVSVGEPNALKFHRLFLFLLQYLGKMHEASLMIFYKVWTQSFLTDMDNGIVMLLKGKIPIFPKPVKDRDEIKNIFERVQKIQSEGFSPGKDD
ncbi:MAG: 4Fe-4S dicluster domain-containing protein [Anaerolineaceae bacterium]|jgi:heterodisulfide reductase subunit C|nr:4Fe-4S dicluster domain-containing protein [Anaerolineaceae bacterium]